MLTALVLAITGSPLAVRAAPLPVDLRLAGAGATSWHIENIKPGDRGEKMLTLRNAGDSPGAVTIWVSDIQDSSTAAPDVTTDLSKSDKLSDYVLFRPVSNRLASGISLPATLGEFPQSAADTAALTMSPLNPGQTLDLTWEWLLPDDTGNEIQGKALSFTLNYSLTELPVVPDTEAPGGDAGPTPTPTPTPTRVPFVITSPERQTAIAVFTDGTVAETRTASLLTNQLTLTLERGTMITTDDTLVPHELRVTVMESPPAPPEGFVMVSPVYELLFITADGPSHAVLSQPGRIVINVNPNNLPDTIGGIFVATYEEGTGWSQLQPLEGFISEIGEVGGMVNHFSLFTVMATMATGGPTDAAPTATTTAAPPVTTEPVITTPPPALLPASFIISRGSLSAERVQVGEPVTLRVNVANTGDLAGEKLVSLKVNGLLLENKLVLVQAGQERNVSFLATPRAPGEYHVDINGVTLTFTVAEGPVTETGSFDYWRWLVLPVLGGLAFVLTGSLVFFARRKKRTTD